jgi:deazaflavin-dependent oxidoreductase (nitroreductase family)
MIESMQSNTLARLKRVAGRQTVRLTHYGRKSGKPFQATIWFVLRGDKVYIGTAKVNRQWVRNVQKTPQVKLSIGGEDFEGTARFLSDPAEIKRAQLGVVRKYWMFSPILLAGKLLGAVGVMRDESGFFEVTLTA